MRHAWFDNNSVWFLTSIRGQTNLDGYGCLHFAWGFTATSFTLLCAAGLFRIRSWRADLLGVFWLLSPRFREFCCIPIWLIVSSHALDTSLWFVVARLSTLSSRPFPTYKILQSPNQKYRKLPICLLQPSCCNSIPPKIKTPKKVDKKAQMWYYISLLTIEWRTNREVVRSISSACSYKRQPKRRKRCRLTSR